MREKFNIYKEHAIKALLVEKIIDIFIFSEDTTKKNSFNFLHKLYI